MKILMLAALGAAFLTAGAAQAQTLTLKLEGVQPRGGRVMIAVQKRDQYMAPAMATGAILDGATKGDVAVDLPIEPGEYAVTVLHDVDGDFDMTRSPDGERAEGWATVNQAALRAKPTFDQVKFVVDGDTALTLPMVYPAN